MSAAPQSGSRRCTLSPDGFVMVPNSVLPDLLRLPRSCIAVYLVIAAHRNRRTKESFPSRSMIAAEADINIGSVGRALNKLVSSGLLKRQSGRGSRTTNVYRIPAADALDQRGERRPAEPVHRPDADREKGRAGAPNRVNHDRAAAKATDAPQRPNGRAGAGPMDAPARHKHTHEQTHQQTNEQKEAEGFATRGDESDEWRLLVLNGVDEPEAKKLVGRYKPARIQEVVDYVRGQDRVENPGGLIQSLLVKKSRPEHFTSGGALERMIEPLRRREPDQSIGSVLKRLAADTATCDGLSSQSNEAERREAS